MLKLKEIKMKEQKKAEVHSYSDVAKKFENSFNQPNLSRNEVRVQQLE